MSAGRGDAGPGRPAALASVGPDREMHVDVRDDIRSGKEPFARIMEAVKALAPGAVLVLRAPFEPVPLYGVLGSQGFSHWTERRAPDDVSVWFYRQAGTESRAEPVNAGGEAGAGSALTVDVRGLEPPRPMVQILAALERLAPGGRLEVLHERRPVFLYPQLDERGYRHETEESPGLVRIVIRRADAAP
jgi:uncharacterized protein (DUF2249 family)